MVFSGWIISNYLSSSSLIICFAWPRLLLKFYWILHFSHCIFKLKNLFIFVLFSITLPSFSFCCCVVFLILLNCVSVFLCSSLSIFRTIILHSLFNLYISISLGSITRSLLHSFGDIVFPWFFIIPIVLHRCLQNYRDLKKQVISSRLCGLTSVRKDLHLWEDGIECYDSTSSGSGHEVQVCVVVLVQGVVMSHQLKLLRSTALTTLCTLACAVMSPQWLKGLLGSSAGLPVTRDQGRQWWWLDLVECTHLAEYTSCSCLCSDETVCSPVITHSGGGWVNSNGSGQLGYTGSCRGSGCWCTLFWLQGLTSSVCIAV